jgi:phenylpyruvate tautomerase PptA (4-oxalocrotonate tautomerase family)
MMMMQLLLLLLLITNVLSFNNMNKMRSRLNGFVLNPTLLIQTSESFDDQSKKTAFLKECSSTISKILGKPEQYVMISYKHSDGMYFNGSEDPAAFCHLASIGRIGPDYNPKVSSAICKVLSTHLSIPSERVYIQFYDSQASNFGYDGSTFG